jgi:hypothetical protein
MTPDEKPTIVSLETHRRRRLAESRRNAVQARKAHGAVREKAVNWRKVPKALLALALLLIVTLLIQRVLHH